MDISPATSNEAMPYKVSVSWGGRCLDSVNGQLVSKESGDRQMVSVRPTNMQSVSPCTGCFISQVRIMDKWCLAVWVRPAGVGEIA